MKKGVTLKYANNFFLIVYASAKIYQLDVLTYTRQTGRNHYGNAKIKTKFID
jgi:hypothetical protein